MTRWQAVHLLPVHLFYRFLTLHGLNMLIFFIIFFEMAVLYFAGPVLLNSRLPAFRAGWLAFGLMVAGMLLANAMVLQGRADVLFTSYPPLQAHPLYYLGIILFAVGALIVTALFFATLVVARREGTYEGSIPLVSFGALTAAIIAVITLLHGAVIYIPTLLWSLGYMQATRRSTAWCGGASGARRNRSTSRGRDHVRARGVERAGQAPHVRGPCSLCSGARRARHVRERSSGHAIAPSSTWARREWELSDRRSPECATLRGRAGDRRDPTFVGAPRPAGPSPATACSAHCVLARCNSAGEQDQADVARREVRH